MSDEWPFCDCGTTLLDGEDECVTCAGAPHGRDCCCDRCEAYWERVCAESAAAAEKANRALVCSCGWTGAFIEHHDSPAYGAQPVEGCIVSYREPVDARERAVWLVRRDGKWVQAP